MTTAIRRQPAIVEINGQKRISNAQFNVPLVAKFMTEQKRDRWVKIEEITRYVKHRNSEHDRRLVRGKLRSVIDYLEAQGLVLLVDYSGNHGAAIAAKIYRGQTEEEKQTAYEILATMRAKSEIADDKARRLSVLIEATELGVAQQSEPEKKAS